VNVPGDRALRDTLPEFAELVRRMAEGALALEPVRISGRADLGLDSD
jgi:hypothetical protein